MELSESSGRVVWVLNPASYRVLGVLAGVLAGAQGHLRGGAGSGRGLRPRAWGGCQGVGSLSAAKRPEIFCIGGVTEPTKPTKPGFVGFVGSTSRGI